VTDDPDLQDLHLYLSSAIFFNSQANIHTAPGTNGQRYSIPSSSGCTSPMQKQIYGPIIQIKAVSKRIVIIDSHQVATELLTGRGQIYSGRPVFHMSGREVGWDRILTLAQPGEYLREARRMFHRTIDGKRVERVRLSLKMPTRGA
jgi:hypothetical protein